MKLNGVTFKQIPDLYLCFSVTALRTYFVECISLIIADLVKVHLRQISTVLNTSQVWPCVISMAIPSPLALVSTALLVLWCLSANLEPDTRWQFCIFYFCAVLFICW